MQTYLVRLTFSAPLHYKEHGVGEESAASWLHSDTLYSALWSIWGRYHLGDGVQALLDGFQSDDTPPFRLTSAFPFIEGDIYLLPKPRGIRLSEKPDKALKKAEWLPLPALLKLAKGDSLEPADLVAKERLNQAIQHDRRPRVWFGQEGGANLFATGQTFFGPGAGLWFLLQAKPARLPQIEEALRHLGEDGLGGNRTTGWGAFTYALDPIDAQFATLLAGPAGANAHLLLSLAHPAPGEEPSMGASFDTLRRGGWAPVGHGQEVRRQIVRMITEGSLLTAPIRGRVVEVTPEGWSGAHPLYRGGLAFTIPVRRKEAE